MSVSRTVFQVMLVGAVVCAATLIAPSPRARAQAPAPVVDAMSFLNMRFYPDQGGFLIERIQVAFVPEGTVGEAVVTRGDEVVATVPLRYEAEGSHLPVFGDFLPNGTPGFLSLGQPGDYKITVKAAGQPIGELAFSMTKEDSGDPFHPTANFRREGAWRSLAALSATADGRDKRLHITLWTSLHEVGVTENRANATVHLLRGNREIAATRTMVLSQQSWNERTQPFKKPDNNWVELGSLADGAYKVVLRRDGTDIKSWTFRVTGGHIQPVARGRLDHTPRMEMLLPRTVTGSGSRAQERELFWLEAAPPRRR